MTDRTLTDQALEHQRSGRLSEATDLYRQALTLDPGNPQIHTSLANILQTQGQIDEAIVGYQRAISLDPALHPAWYALGCAWSTKKEDANALDCFAKAIELSPAHGPSHHNIGKTLFRLGLIDEAIERFRTAIALGEGFLPRTAIATTIPGSPNADHRAVLQARREWAETHLPPLDAHKKFVRQSAEHRPLRIGYISSFFHRRNWMKPVWGLVNRHDRERFQISLFSDAPESACAGYSKNPADEFHDISTLTNAAAAEAIAACNLDILVDLNSFSDVRRLAVIALKPAPLVVAWFNLYATSGMASYDYIVGDRHVILPEDETFYIEKVLRLPCSYLTFEVTYPVPDVAPPPASIQPRFTFGCFASQYKITPRVIATWCEILRRSANAVLLLKNSTLGGTANREFLYRRFAEHGIPRDQVQMEGPSDHNQFLTAYGRVDVALDTFPYNGGTTTSEALWQGVPVLTFRGDRWASRQSASLLAEAGLQNFIALDRDGYVEQAIAIATSLETPTYLADLRRSMRSRLARSSVCNTAVLAQHMEGFYRQIFDDWWKHNS